MIKDGHRFDDESSKKAANLIETIRKTFNRSLDDFILGLVPLSADESTKEFVSSMVVLASSANQTIITSMLRMVTTLIRQTSPKQRLSLVHLNLVPHLLSAINVRSLSFADGQDLILFVAGLLIQLLSLASLHTLAKLEAEHHLNRQAVHEAVLQHILVPSEEFIRHICLNRLSISTEALSNQFMSFLTQILHISPYHVPTMDFIRTLPIVLSIPSFLTFCSFDPTIESFLDDVIVVQSEWDRQGGSVRQSGIVISRLLPMEGFSDVLEQLMTTDKEGDSGGYAVDHSSSLCPTEMTSNERHQPIRTHLLHSTQPTTRRLHSPRMMQRMHTKREEAHKHATVDSSDRNGFDQSGSVVDTPIPAPLVTLPPLLFTNPSHFITNGTTLTRSDVDLLFRGSARHSSTFLRDPIDNGIVSVTLTILNLSRRSSFIRIGLLDSTAPVPKMDELLGSDVKDSISLNSSTGNIYHNTPSTQHISNSTICHFFLKEGDCVRMEVDMDSNPRTVQFFVNGESGRSFLSGLPPSVRIGFSTYGQEISCRIDRIIRQTQRTPIAPEMEKIKWE
ncbi:hypothetical protein BLNAU_21827 [Blattamonas nauphoetae]|uniref:Uncharacterized protein n=1 Tax=Blattamonas nauphoetae TaxID=2049346 RepID=A0ABQ9WZ18_9EUKA|nr:hypothetical protein BLNAU_21827 [Blattamonas nauphoetae]